MDTNLNEAYWASYNSKADDFTKQFLGENPLIGSYDSITTSSKYNTKIQLYAKTEIRSIEKPLITVVSDTIIKKDRKICISILSNRNANKIELISKLPIQFKTFKINLKRDIIKSFNMMIKNNFDSLNTVSVLKTFIWKGSKSLNYNSFKAPNSQDLPNNFFELTFGLNIISRKNMIKFKNIVGRKIK